VVSRVRALLLRGIRKASTAVPLAVLRRASIEDKKPAHELTSVLLLLTSDTLAVAAALAQEENENRSVIGSAPVVSSARYFANLSCAISRSPGSMR